MESVAQRTYYNLQLRLQKSKFSPSRLPGSIVNDNNQSTFAFALKSSWALLLGFGILMLGDGLQASLLAIRADLEGFSTTTTGLIMSSFYVGFLCGSILTPRIMVLVGHIRVFAALAALASAAILIHAVFVEISVWILLRLVSGFCFAGLYVVAESWLNDRATNESRGKVLSLYMVVTYVGVGIGQLFLNLGSPSDYPLFILTSVLVSIAVLPLLLSAGSPPEYVDSVNIKLSELFRVSPLGVVGVFIEGMVTATFFALGPVYAQRIGMDVKNISYFMTIAVVGTILLQWPIGALSDRFNRRTVLTAITFLAMGTAVLCALFGELNRLWLFVLVGLFCGLSLPLYSVSIAHTNDHLRPEQMIAASGTLVLVGGLGAVSGPLVVAFVMDSTGISGFFWCMGAAHLLTGLFALYRIAKRAATPLEEQGSYTPAGLHPSSVVIESMQQYAKEEELRKSGRSPDQPPGDIRE